MSNYNRGFLYFICAVSAMGGLLFGYDWVVIGGAKPFYELYFAISDSPLMQGVAMTTALVGCLVGAMLAGSAADRYGRKPLLMLSAVLFLLMSFFIPESPVYLRLKETGVRSQETGVRLPTENGELRGERFSQRLEVFSEVRGERLEVRGERLENSTQGLEGATDISLTSHLSPLTSKKYPLTSHL